MTWNKLLRLSALLAIIAVNIGCDQVSKAVVRKNLDYHDNIQIVQDHVVLTKVENSGAFLSLGDALHPGAKTVLLLVLPGLALLLMGVWALSQNVLGKAATIALCSIVGGGIGNIFDRAVYGSVTDFLYLNLGIFHTGVFNLADVSITGSVLFLVGQQLFQMFKAKSS